MTNISFGHDFYIEIWLSPRKVRKEFCKFQVWSNRLRDGRALKWTQFTEKLEKPKEISWLRRKEAIQWSHSKRIRETAASGVEESPYEILRQVAKEQNELFAREKKMLLNYFAFNYVEFQSWIFSFFYIQKLSGIFSIVASIQLLNSKRYAKPDLMQHFSSIRERHFPIPQSMI